MKHNSINLGERSYCGNYGRILSAGEINVSDSTLRCLYAAGETNFERCKIGKIRNAGEVNLNSCTCGSVVIIGEGNFRGICSADTVEVCGEISADSLECRILHNKFIDKSKMHMKNPAYHGYFKAETFENSDDMTLNFNYDFKNIILTAPLTVTGELVCEQLYAFSPFTAESVNAGHIVIISNGELKISSVTGETISIMRRYRTDKDFSIIPKLVNYKSKYFYDGNIPTIDSIEGDNITLEGLNCGSVCGKNISIGDLCIIDHVEYSGELTISPKAAVCETIKI